MSRLFERHKGGRGGRDFYCVVCSRCGVVAKKNGDIPPHVASHMFTAMGWGVGRDESADLCPTHANVRPEKQVDPEKPIVDRVLNTMKGFEDALAIYTKLDQPKHSERVMQELQAFRTRVFGN